MDQIVHSELFGTLAKICLEKLCTILPFFAWVDKIADEWYHTFCQLGHLSSRKIYQIAADSTSKDIFIMTI